MNKKYYFAVWLIMLALSVLTLPFNFSVNDLSFGRSFNDFIPFLAIVGCFASFAFTEPYFGNKVRSALIGFWLIVSLLPVFSILTSLAQGVDVGFGVIGVIYTPILLAIYVVSFLTILALKKLSQSQNHAVMYFLGACSALFLVGAVMYNFNNPKCYYVECVAYRNDAGGIENSVSVSNKIKQFQSDGLVQGRDFFILIGNDHNVSDAVLKSQFRQYLVDKGIKERVLVPEPTGAGYWGEIKFVPNGYYLSIGDSSQFPLDPLKASSVGGFRVMKGVTLLGSKTLSGSNPLGENASYTQRKITDPKLLAYNIQEFEKSSENGPSDKYLFLEKSGMYITLRSYNSDADWSDLEEIALSLN